MRRPDSHHFLIYLQLIIFLSDKHYDTLMEFTNPSPQLQTVLAFLQAVTDQIVDDMLKHVSDDFEWHWVTPGFDMLGPRVKNKEQTRDFFTRFGNSFVKDFKVRNPTTDSSRGLTK